MKDMAVAPARGCERVRRACNLLEAAGEKRFVISSGERNGAIGRRDKPGLFVFNESSVGRQALPCWAVVKDYCLLLAAAHDG
jgi:hypothetical protein